MVDDVVRLIGNWQRASCKKVKSWKIMEHEHAPGVGLKQTRSALVCYDDGITLSRCETQLSANEMC
jgi:hypothetical protein